MTNLSLMLTLGAGLLGAQQPPPRPPALPASVTQPASVALPDDYVIGAEDKLGIVFWREADLSGDVTVRPDGRVTLPVIGELQASGLRPDELRKQIEVAAANYLTEPNVAVVVREINSRRVFVTGRVSTPGVHLLKGSLTVMQAIALSGGLTEFADGKNIKVLRVVGGKSVTLPFNYKDVVRGRKLEQNVLLLPGDTVVVP